VIVIITVIENKGRAVHLLKPDAKRKRSRQEMEAVKEEEDKFKEDKQQYFQKVKRLKLEKEERDLQYNAGIAALEIV
jgi:ABC-type siderophore export system fused ATPase/permease subunit